MENIFLCLLINLKNHGKLSSALFRDENYATVTVEDNNSEYVVTVMKREKVEVEKDGN